MGSQNKILAIDFDGCCVEDTFPLKGEDVPCGVYVLKELVRRGWRLVLWTCRRNHGPGKEAYLDHAIEWFKKRDLPLLSVDKIPEEYRPLTVKGTKPNVQPSPKIFAQYYIDDAIPGGFQGWLNIFKLIEGEDY